MKAILASLALAAPAVASAGPMTYLDCQLPSPEGPKVARIAMDEERKEVIYQLPSEKMTRRLPAVFTRSDVTFSVADGAGEITFSVNRLNLSVERYRRVGIDKSPTSHGSCAATTSP